MGTTANPVSNAPSGGVYANVDNTGKPLTEEEYRQLEKRLAQEGQNGMLEQLYGDKNEKRNGGASKIEDSGSKGNGGEKEPADNKSSVFYPSSSPYHHANSKNSTQSTKARTSSAGTNVQMPQGDRFPTSGSWYDRVGPIGVVAAIIFVLVLLVLLIWIATKATAIEEGIEAIKEEIEAIKCQLKHIKSQLKTCDDCLVQKVVTTITSNNTDY